MKIYIPERIYNENIEQLNEANVEGVVFGVLPPEEEEIHLPDLNDSFTRMYFEGTIKSFLPPQHHPHLNLFTVVVDEIPSPRHKEYSYSMEEKEEFPSEEHKLKDTIHSLFSQTTHYRTVFTVYVERNIIIMPIEVFFHFELLNPIEIFRKLPSDEFEDYSYGGLGGWVSIFASLARPTFFFDGREMIFLGTKS